MSPGLPVEPAPAKPAAPRIWRPMILWTAAILAALGVAWFIGAVAVPVWQTRAAVQAVYDKLSPWYEVGGIGVDSQRTSERQAAVERLGGPDLAARRLGFYLMLPEWTDSKRRLIPILDHGSREEAYKILGFCGRSGLPPLVRSLGDPRSGWRFEAARALGNIGPAAGEAVPELAKVLNDGDRLLRWAATLALGQIGPAAQPAVPALIRLAGADTLPDVRAEACESLGIIGNLSAVQVLTKALTDNAEEVRSRAAEALGRLGPEAEGAVPALALALQDADPHTRARVAQALACMAPRVKAAVPALSRALSDDDAYVRWAAADALGGAGPDAAPAVPYLAKALKHEDSKTRWMAAQALGQIGEASLEAVPALIEALGDHQCADDAARALGRIGPKAKVSIPALEKCVSQGEKSLRAAAAEALTKIRREEPSK